MFCDNNGLVSGIKNGIDRGDLGIAVFASKCFMREGIPSSMRTMSPRERADTTPTLPKSASSSIMFAISMVEETLSIPT